ncbi:MAG: hypothetical protein LBU87_01450, partial [Lactobacillales bacterium]|nr:hypothetical protein [Lactobacillales bacterium]
MRPSFLNPLFQEVSKLEGVGPKTSKLLMALTGPYLIHNLFHLPASVRYRPHPISLDDIHLNELGTIQVKILTHIAPKNRRSPYRIIGQWGDVEVELIFFNFHKSYLSAKLKENETVWLSGKLERHGGQVKIMHPDYIEYDPAKIP